MDCIHHISRCGLNKLECYLLYSTRLIEGMCVSFPVILYFLWFLYENMMMMQHGFCIYHALCKHQQTLSICQYDDLWHTDIRQYQLCLCTYKQNLLVCHYDAWRNTDISNIGYVCQNTNKSFWSASMMLGRIFMEYHVSENTNKSFVCQFDVWWIADINSITYVC